MGGKFEHPTSWKKDDATWRLSKEGPISFVAALEPGVHRIPYESFRWSVSCSYYVPSASAAVRVLKDLRAGYTPHRRSPIKGVRQPQYLQTRKLKIFDVWLPLFKSKHMKYFLWPPAFHHVDKKRPYNCRLYLKPENPAEKSSAEYAELTRRESNWRSGGEWCTAEAPAPPPPPPAPPS